ncbi:MAG: carboxypeptidase-like regulatory domain-containing protein [Acidobacteriota bacterium]
MRRWEVPAAADTKLRARELLRNMKDGAPGNQPRLSKMKKAHLIVAIISLLSFSSTICSAQTVAKDPPASISGRITIGGKGAADISVVATATTTNIFDTRASAKAATDDEGNYRITGLPPGRFTVLPVAKAYAIAATGVGRVQQPRSINVLAGDEITKVDFALVRGGVITGRITDADGSPIIGEHVTILPSGTQYAAYIVTNLDGLKNRSDDRGIYRSYGLAPGTYKVSVGQPKPQSAANAMFRSGSQYVQTFYPGVLDESKATLIEIKEGSEAKDIDISAGKGARGFSVSGRVVDSTSGQPAANIYVGYSVIEDPNQAIGGGMSFSSSVTDVNGKFTLEGLQPGQYAAFTMGIGTDNTSYSETTKFEVIDGDVSGVEIKLGRGATINGIAVVENSHDPAAVAILPTVNLYAFAERKPGSAPSFARARINADHSFKFSGLAPGKIRIAVQEYPTPPKGLNLLRVELNGIE